MQFTPTEITAARVVSRSRGGGRAARSRRLLSASLIGNINITPSGTPAHDFTVVGGSLFFLTGLASEGGPYGLWRTDGTSAGTERLQGPTSPIRPYGELVPSSVLIKLLLVLVLLLLVGVPVLWVRAKAVAEREAQVERNAARRAALAEQDAHRNPSPFEAVRWKGSTPLVQVGGTWYALVSMDGLSAEQIVAGCQVLDPDGWRSRFDQDLVEVLVRLGHPLGRRTSLEVRDLGSGQVRSMSNVPLRRETRDAVSTRPSEAP